MARFLLSAFADESAKDILEQVKECKKNNLTHIELRGYELNGISKNISDISVSDALELKHILDENQIEVSAIGSKYGKIDITDNNEEPFRAFKNTVEVAKILNAKYIRIFSYYNNTKIKQEEYRAEVIKRVQEMADYSANFGIKCCHENEKGVYGKTVANCLDLRENVGENLGIIFDPANFIECGEDVNMAYETLEKYLTNIHLKDIVKASGEIVPCGEGDANIQNLLKRFSNLFGTRFLTIEPHLNAFDGLSSFDKETVEKLSEKKTIYKSLSDSFAVACNAVHKILNNVQPIRLGIIGMGNMGGNHLKNYCNGELHEIRITAVAELKKDKLDAVKDKAFGIKFYNSDEELINSGEVDAVLIAVPHYQHLEIAKKAMLKGLHVMVEKPAGVYAKAVREFDEFCKGRNEVAALMLNQRTNHTFRKAKELLESGKFGEIKRVVWIITDWYRTEQYYRSGGWRATWGGEGGGVLLNQAPHNLDLWQWLCGMPKKIRAFCHEGKWHNIEVEDDVTIYAEYPNGATGVFITTTGDCPGTNRLEITLDKGRIICNTKGIEVIELEKSVKENTETAKGGFAKVPYTEYIPETDGLNEQHSGVLNAFAAHILRGEPLIAEVKEGLREITISNAAYLSTWLDKTIELPMDDDLFYEMLQKKIAESTFVKEVEDVVDEDMSASFNNK